MNMVAKNLRKLRNRKGLSQERMAQDLHVTRQAISNWETGKTQPDIDTLIRISSILEVELEELIYGERPKNEFESGKTQRGIRACILLSVSVVLFFIRVLATPYLTKYLYTPLSRNIHVYYDCLLYGLIGVALFSLLSVWKDVRIRNQRKRRLLLAIGVCILVLYYVLTNTALSASAFAHWIIPMLLNFKVLFVIPLLLIYLALTP